MKEEYLDLVDEGNYPTGKSEQRSIVHSTGLWHRTVHIYLFKKTEQGIEFLVHLRSKNKDLHPDCWDTRFGGHIKTGVDLETSVIDEIKEEIGVDINLSKLIEGEWRKRNRYPNCEFSKVYYLEYNQQLENLSFNDGEVQKVKWLPFVEVLKEMEHDPKKWSGSKKDFEHVTQFLIHKISSEFL